MRLPGGRETVAMRARKRLDEAIARWNGVR
jgi:hypothetical protein